MPAVVDRISGFIPASVDKKYRQKINKNSVRGFEIRIRSRRCYWPSRMLNVLCIFVCTGSRSSYVIAEGGWSICEAPLGVMRHRATYATITHPAFDRHMVSSHLSGELRCDINDERPRWEPSLRDFAESSLRPRWPLRWTSLIMNIHASLAANRALVCHVFYWKFLNSGRSTGSRPHSARIFTIFEMRRSPLTSVSPRLFTPRREDQTNPLKTTFTINRQISYNAIHGVN